MMAVLFRVVTGFNPQWKDLVYPIVATAVGATVVKAPPRGFEHDLEAFASLLSPRTRVVFLANPNNPTAPP